MRNPPKGWTDIHSMTHTGIDGDTPFIYYNGMFITENKNIKKGEKMQITDDMKKLAELMYMDMNPDRKREFQELQQVYKDKWYSKAHSAINCLSKMNKIIVTPGQVKKEVDERFLFNKVEGIIRDFLKGVKTTKAELFPVEELAHKILGD